MRLILYSQPFRSLFCKVQDLDTQHFQLACPLSQCGDLMWYCNVGKVHIDDLYNLVIVIADALKLEIKVVKSGDELRLRRVASDNDGLLAEDSFNNKTTPVMLQSDFAEQLAKADVLLFIKPERVFITRRSGLLIGLVCRGSVHIHIWLKKDRSRVATRTSQSENLCRTKVQLAVFWRKQKFAAEDFYRRFRKFSNFSLRRWASRLSFAGSFICFGIPESRTNGEFAAELRHRTVDRNTAPDGNLPDFTILLLGAHAENKIKYLETRYLLFFALPVTYNSPAVKRPGCCDFKLPPSWDPLREPAEEWVFRSCPHCFHNARYSPAANATAVWRVRA